MNNKELIDKYLNHELNEEELLSFNTRYIDDTTFKNQVDLYKDLIKGIRQSGISKIKSDIRAIHSEIMPEINSNMAFESDLTQALRLKQQAAIKNEIIKTKMDMNKFTNNNKETTNKSKVVSLKMYRVIAIAASLLLVFMAGQYLFKKNDPINSEGLAKAYDIIKLGAQSSGIADPNQSLYIHQQKVFDLVDRRQIDSARIIQDTYYSSQAKTADYFVMNGLIYFKSGKNSLAKKSFNDGIKHGDQCLSQLLLALMEDKGITVTNSIVSKVRENPTCQASVLVNSILKELKW